MLAHRTHPARAACLVTSIGWTAYWTWRLILSRPDLFIPAPAAFLSAALPLLAALAAIGVAGRRKS